MGNLAFLAVLSSAALAVQAQPAPRGKSAKSEANRPRLYVTFNMDCERIRSECTCGGPKTWASSEQSIRGFCDLLLGAKIPPTLFVVPETGQQHKALFEVLAKRGAELGMHVHPQCWQDHRYDRYLGDYDAEMQKKILQEGIDMFVDTFGRRPRSFRSGNFSASDETYRVLVELGFRQGSVSDPGRYAPRFHADWKEATPQVHWANARNRLIPGRLPFLEVPVTTDPEKRRASGFPHELRIESGNFNDWHLPIINRALKRMEKDKVPFRALCIFTHNYWDYSDPDVPQTRTLRAYVEHLKVLARDYEVIPATLATIRKHYEKATPHSRPAPRERAVTH